MVRGKSNVEGFEAAEATYIIEEVDGFLRDINLGLLAQLAMQIDKPISRSRSADECLTRFQSALFDGDLLIAHPLPAPWMTGRRVQYPGKSARILTP
jgi:hypothetical protein